MVRQDVMKRHADLFDRMVARVAGDLEDAAAKGRIGMGEIVDAVTRCAACRMPDACDAWLADGRQPVDAPPYYCRNIPVVEALRASQRGT